MAKVVQRTMWGKSREKKAARMYHTRNFGTGLVEADEYYLSRVGLRGRKRWLLLCGLLCAYLIVVGHLVLTCVILGVLHFNSTGPPYFIFNDDGSLEWPQGATISDVWLDGALEAYNNHSLTIAGQNNQQIAFQSGNQIFSAAENSILDSSRASLSPSETRVTPFKSFAITHSGRPLLSVNSSLAVMAGVSSLNQLTTTTGLTTSTVRAPLDSDLTVGSGSESLSLHGGNGVFLGGRNVNITSPNSLNIVAKVGSVVIEGAEGVTLQGLPSQLSNPSFNYHVCACTGTRRLFLVPSNPQRCAAAAAVEDIDTICSL